MKALRLCILIFLKICPSHRLRTRITAFSNLKVTRLPKKTVSRSEVCCKVHLSTSNMTTTYILRTKSLKNNNWRLMLFKTQLVLVESLGPAVRRSRSIRLSLTRRLAKYKIKANRMRCSNSSTCRRCPVLKTRMRRMCHRMKKNQVWQRQSSWMRVSMRNPGKGVPISRYLMKTSRVALLASRMSSRAVEGPWKKCLHV